jgi:hypothetical protein
MIHLVDHDGKDNSIGVSSWRIGKEIFNRNWILLTPHLLVTILNPGISFKATLCVRGSPISRRFPPKGVILTFYSTRKHFK